MIQQAIDDYTAERLSDLEYLKKIKSIRNALTSNQREDIPAEIRDDPVAAAYYGIVRIKLAKEQQETDGDALLATTLALREIIRTSDDKTDFWQNTEEIRKVRNDMDNFFYDTLGRQYGINLNGEQMDDIADKILQVARNRAQRQ